MLKKFTNKKGFTLMEMLIVVAIIVVLVAIAIPTFSGALTKAKEATDVANVRAAYAEWQVSILTDGAAVPTDKDAFAAKIDGTLNYDNKLTCNKSGNNLDITYAAEKLPGTFKWTLKPIDID